MDWAIVIFLVVAGTTAGSLWWWCASEVEKAGRDDAPREVTTPIPGQRHATLHPTRSQALGRAERSEWHRKRTGSGADHRAGPGGWSRRGTAKRHGTG